MSRFFDVKRGRKIPEVDINSVCIFCQILRLSVEFDLRAPAPFGSGEKFNIGGTHLFSVYVPSHFLENLSSKDDSKIPDDKPT